MSAATAEKPAERMVSAPDTSIVFTARRESLRLVIRPERMKRDPEGNPVEAITGEHLAFTNGILRVPAQKHMRGEKGEQLEVARVLEFLRGHHLLGDREEGFWELHQPAPAPTAEEMDKIAELGMDLDAASLRELIGQEEAGWKREAVLTVARTTLERVERRQEKPAAEKQEGKGA